jgi:hypothetical protein
MASPIRNISAPPLSPSSNSGTAPLAIFRGVLEHLRASHIESLKEPNFWAFLIGSLVPGSSYQSVQEVFQDAGLPIDDMEDVVTLGFPEDIHLRQVPQAFGGDRAFYALYCLVLSMLPSSYCLMMNEHEGLVDYGLRIGAPEDLDAMVVRHLCRSVFDDTFNTPEPSAMDLVDDNFAYFKVFGRQLPILIPSLAMVRSAVEGHYDEPSRSPIRLIFPEAGRAIDFEEAYPST